MFTFSPLWKLLIDNNMTKTQLREKIGFSTATLSKLSKDEYVSMQVLDEICKALKVRSISDVVEYVPASTNTDSLPDTELEILEEVLDDIEYKISKKEHISKSDMVYLYNLLLKTIDVRETFNEQEYNRFQQAYITCVKLLPFDMSSQIILSLMNSVNITPKI